MLYKVPEDGHMQWPKHVAVQHRLKYSTSAVWPYNLLCLCCFYSTVGLCL